MPKNNQKIYEDACLNGDLQTIKNLINRVDISNDKFCGFVNACEKGHFEIVKYHVDNCDNLNIHSNKDEPFVIACWNNNLDIAKYLFKLGGKRTRNIISNGAPLTGCYPGISFLGGGALDVFNWLLEEFGPNSNDPLIDIKILNEVLMNCAEGGYLDIFKKVINEYNINILQEQIDGPCIKWACRNYNYKILKYIAQNYGKTVNWSYQDNFGIKFLLSEVQDNTMNCREIVNMLLREKIYDIDTIKSFTNGLYSNIDNVTQYLKIV